MAIASGEYLARLRQGGKPIVICSSKYKNNTIEQDHRRVKRRIRSMLGFKSEAAASITLTGIKLIHMMRKLQGNFGPTEPLSLKQQFTTLACWFPRGTEPVFPPRSEPPLTMVL